jgi:hypothetical protein
VFYDDVTNNFAPNSAYCIAHVRPYSEFAADLAGSSVARYNFIVPNLCNDMHDCSISTGDAWLSTEIPKIQNSAAYKNGGAIFITWDEGEGTVSDGPIGMIVVSPAAKGGGYYNTTYYNHSSLLLTLQEILGTRPLLGDAPNATDLSDLFASFPAVTPSTPTPADGSIGMGNSVTLKWSSSGDNDDMYFGTTNPPPLAASSVTTHTYARSGLAGGITYYWYVVSHASPSTPGPVWRFSTASISTLPSPWSDTDIGPVGLAGSATYASGTFTIKAAGADIWSTSDGFHYVYQAKSGDAQIVARVKQLQNTNPKAKAGVMLRFGLAANAPHVLLDVKAGGDVELLQRSTSGGSTHSLGSVSATVPLWLSLTRTGSTITAALSMNGTTWTTVASATIGASSTPSVGLAVTSHSTSKLATATIDMVSVTP